LIADIQSPNTPISSIIDASAIGNFGITGTGNIEAVLFGNQPNISGIAARLLAEGTLYADLQGIDPQPQPRKKISRGSGGADSRWTNWHYEYVAFDPPNDTSPDYSNPYFTHPEHYEYQQQHIIAGTSSQPSWFLILLGILGGIMVGTQIRK